MTQCQINSRQPLVQFKYTILNTSVAVTSGFPKDNTIPQQTEGVEVMTVSITPTKATNLLEIYAFVWGQRDDNACDLEMAFFRDSTANAIAACEGIYQPTTGGDNVGTLTTVVTAGSTSATTFKLRCGQISGGTLYIPRGQFGGVDTCFMSVREIEV